MPILLASRRLFLTLMGVVGLSLASPALALDKQTAAALVAQTTDEAIAIAKLQADPATRTARFRALMERNAAMPQIARFAIGRGWQAMSPEQQTRYTALFIDHLARTYVKRFDEYRDQTIKQVGFIEDERKGILVQTQVVGGKAPIAVDWLVSDRSGKPQINDLTIEGVSMAITLRAEFTALLERHGDIEKFLAALQAGTQ